MGKHFYGEELKDVGIDSMEADCSFDKNGGIDSKVSVVGIDGRKTVINTHEKSDGKLYSGILRTYDERGLEVGSIDAEGHTSGVLSNVKKSTVDDGINKIKAVPEGVKSVLKCSR